jgi:FixJ family two-component response regulator
MPAQSVRPIVFVVDDDTLVRDVIEHLLESVASKSTSSLRRRSFSRVGPDAPACLVLHVPLPEQSGLDFGKRWWRAVEFLPKPFRDQDLLDAIQAAIARDRARRGDARVLVELRRRFAALTAREQDIMRQVAGNLVEH